MWTSDIEIRFYMNALTHERLAEARRAAMARRAMRRPTLISALRKLRAELDADDAQSRIADARPAPLTTPSLRN